MDFTEPSSRYKAVIDAVKRYVLEKEGSKEIRLPSENQLATRLGISRAHVREVYRALCVFGVCESRQGEGTFIRNGSDQELYNALSVLMIGRSVDAMETMEVRKVLEAGLAENAAINRSASDVRDLKLCLSKMKNCTEHRAMSQYDTELHKIISRACGNEILVELSAAIGVIVHKSIQEHWKYIFSDPDHTIWDKTYAQHVELVEAIAARKPSIAKSIAQEHVDLVIRSLNKYKEGET